MSIQSPAKCEIRSVIRYLIWKGKTPVEVYNKVQTAYGDKGMNRTSVFKWCREFKNGRTSVHDDQRSGRPSILTDDIVEKIENANNLIARIARLENLKDTVRECFVQVDAGYSAELRWRKIDTMFESRIVVSGLQEWYASRVVESVLTSLEEFQGRNSGWMLSRILNLTINVNKYNPLHAGSYLHYSTVLNLTGIQFPMMLSQIKKFESLNDISEKQKEILPLRLTYRKRGKQINLLIKDLSRLVRSQITARKNTGKFNNYEIRLPSEDKWLSFSNHRRKERVSFYVDLECTLQKMKMDMKTFSYTYQQHRAFSLTYYVHCSMYRFRRDNDCIAWFAKELKNLAHNVNTILSANISMAVFTRDDAMYCHVCEKPFVPDDTWVRDHNLNYKDLYCIPIIEIYLLTRKVIFPYEYDDCIEKLEDTCLLPCESFYNSLTGNTVSENDYAHAMNVWQRFSIRTLGEYNDLYLKTDVLLLANIFENFQDSCITNYGLNPAYYYTLPGFTFREYIEQTMENVRNHVRLVMRWDGRYGVEAMIAKPNFHCILDTFKTCLYEFHHEYMLPLFYEKCKIMYTDTDRIGSKLHEIYTISESKIALSPYDDKRYSVSDSTDTLPW
ncbi:GVQW3 protein, partial [Pseudoatta argentina]